MLKMMQEQFLELERETIQALSQLVELRKKIQEVSGMEEMNEIDEMKIVQVPFAAYETMLERNLEEKKQIEEQHLKEKEQIHERHEAEKDKMRKHYRGIILWIAIPFIVFIIAAFGSVTWFFNNYDFATYTQDGNGLNNIASKTTQGDVIYEPTPENNSIKE